MDSGVNPLSENRLEQDSSHSNLNLAKALLY